MISPGVFFIFFKFWIFWFFGKKYSKMKRNNYIRHMSYLRNSIAYDYDFLVHLCKMMISVSVFFYFFKIFIFWAVIGLKGQKMAQNNEKSCLLCITSQEQCIVWLSFMVPLFKMMVSPCVFSSFSKFWFFLVVTGL